MTSSAKGYVIVVDDEKVIADTLVMILEKFGYLASAAYSGEDGLILCSTFRPDVVISDVVMPQMTGLTLAVRVKEILPDCKIILISGDTTTNDLLDQAASAGEKFDVLAKPVHPLDLLKRVEQSGPALSQDKSLNHLQLAFDRFKPQKPN